MILMLILIVECAYHRTISGKRAPSGELENINVQMYQTKRDTSADGNGTSLVDIAAADIGSTRGNSSVYGDSKESKNFAIEIIVTDKGEGNYGVKYICPSAGEYALEVRVYGELIGHMPKLIPVRASSHTIA